MIKFNSFLFTGHGAYNGGIDPGACGHGHQEHSVATKINEAAKSRLSHLNIQYGVNNYMNILTAGNTYSSCWGISTHLNSATSETATGVEIWIPLSVKDFTAELNLVTKIADILGIANRKVKSRRDNGTAAGETLARTNGIALSGAEYYGEINRAKSHGVNLGILEVAFISNANDIAKVNANIDGIGKIIAEYISSKCGASINNSTNQSNASDMYRVRKSWSDAGSQKGAFSDLNNAKKCADSNPGYKVFNSTGNQVYPSDSSTNITTTSNNISTDEVRRYGEKGVFYPNCTIYFRNAPYVDNVNNPAQGTYTTGEFVEYDTVVIGNRYNWISWVSTSSGTRRYMPIRDKQGDNVMWGRVE